MRPDMRPEELYIDDGEDDEDNDDDDPEGICAKWTCYSMRLIE